MDEFFYEESNPKHVFLNCLAIIFIIGSIFGGIIFYRNKNTIQLKNITVELGSTLSTDINDYLVSENDNVSRYKIDLDSVNINKVGTYNYKVIYKKHEKSAKVIVKDTTAPIVTVSNIIVGTEESIQAMYLVSSCTDLSLPCSAVFEDKDILKKIKTAGEYNTKIKISDAVGNTVTKEVKIESKNGASFDSVMTSNLDYYTNSIKDNTIGKVFFEKLEKAINEDTHEYEAFAQIVSAEDFEEYTKEEIKSVQLITVYNKYGYVIGMQVLATYSDGTKELLTKTGAE